MSDFWAWNPFSVGIKKNKGRLGNTAQVLKQACKLHSASPLKDMDAIQFASWIVSEAVRDFDVSVSDTILFALMEMCEEFFQEEALILLDEQVLSYRPNSRNAIQVREYLRRQIRFIENYQSNMQTLQAHLILACRYLISLVPDYALSTSAANSFLSIPFMDVLHDPTNVVDMIVNSSLFDDDLMHHGLIEPARNRIEANITHISKIDPRLRSVNPYRYIMPSDTQGLNAQKLVDTYLVGTPYRHFFNIELPLAFNEQTRFEHTQILGGTGHGKTQFLQKFIAHDLAKAEQEKRSVVVIDSQGDMIQKIAGLDCFNPVNGTLRDKLIIIDPTDILFPAAINMFAIDEERLASYGEAEREKIQNSAIALYEYFFSELLGAELTAKQGVVFKYLARLMLEIPDATILTLRDLMDDPEPFVPYMKKLKGSARVFFAREFLDRSFNQTKKQISKRLWGVLSTPAFERLFSSKENKIDLFAEMNKGSIILINTAKDLLKQEGAELYGRFFISMIGQAIMERSVISEYERTPTFLYIDECQDYFDKTVEVLLAQGRKYKCSVLLASQHSDFFTTSQRASILANTSTKACGGVNNKDAKLLAQEMQTSADFLQSMQKTKWDTEFALSIKHDVPKAVKITVPFGILEGLPQMNAQQRKQMIERNRNIYCWEYEEEEFEIEFNVHSKKSNPQIPTIVEVSSDTKSIIVTSETPVQIPFPSTPEEVEVVPVHQAPERVYSGKGGKRHIYLQNFIRQLGQERGWRVELEYAVLEGSGQIDVALLRGDRMIACEISISTTAEHEINNVTKCLNAGAEEVWIIAEKKSKLHSIKAEAEKVLGSKSQKLTFLQPDDVPSELDSRSELQGDEKPMIGGYRVKINRSAGSIREAEERRGRIIAALASS